MEEDDQTAELDKACVMFSVVRLADDHPAEVLYSGNVPFDLPAAVGAST
jgi:hypothetical protein